MKGRDVALVCTLNDPDSKTLTLLFAARIARRLEDPLLRRFYREQRVTSLGSGVIVSRHGYVLTNNYVWVSPSAAFTVESTRMRGMIWIKCRSGQQCIVGSVVVTQSSMQPAARGVDGWGVERRKPAEAPAWGVR